jgi:hypothetical protein
MCAHTKNFIRFVKNIALLYLVTQSLKIYFMNFHPGPELISTFVT